MFIIIKAKSTWPGMLDHIVAGAIPYGVSVLENVVKECEEEAGIDRALATTARPTGASSPFLTSVPYRAARVLCNRGGVVCLSG